MPYSLLLEDGYKLLLEDGYSLLLEWTDLAVLTWLNVYNTSGVLKARIFESSITECSIRSNTFGILRFPIHQDAQGRDQLVKGYWIEVYRQTASGGDTLWSGIICHVKKRFDENGDPTRYYEVTARSFEWLPYWRRMVPDANEDYLYNNDIVDVAARYLVSKCMVTGTASAARAIAGLTVVAVGAPHADTKTLAGSYEDKLGAKLEAWAKAYDFDWWVDADCPAATFVLKTKVPRRGSDLSASIIFTVGRHNLLALEYYEDDLDTAQLCYVGGPGEGATQVIRTVYDGAEPTGWSRREMYVPLANAEYTDELDVGGHAWLDSFGDTLTGVRFELNETETGKWRTDFDIGDLVTVYDADFGIDKVAEIKEVNYTLDEDGIEHIELLVGEPQPSKWDLLQAGMGQYSSFDDDSAPATPANPSHATSSGLDDDNKYYAILTLDWNDNVELDLTGYQVEVLLTGETKWQTQKVTASEAIFENLKMGASYRARVKAVDRAGNESAYLDFNSANVIAMPTNAAPAVPTNLSVSTATITDDDGKTQAYLNCSWTANGEADFSHYEISWTVAAKSRTVKTSTNSHYVFPVDCNAAYSVQVKAIDTADNASAYCAAASGTTARDTVAPATPTGLAVTAAKKSIRITITRPSATDWAGCEFHVSTSTGFTPIAGTLVHDGKTTSYTYNTASYVVHYVKVRAYDASGNYSAYCAQGSATPEKTGGAADGDDITPGSVGTVDCANLFCTTALINNLAVTAAKIGSLAVETAKIDDLAVSTAKIGNLQVTEGKIANLAVTNAKIANATIESAKIVSLVAEKISAGTITGVNIAATATIGFTDGATFQSDVAGVTKVTNSLRTVDFLLAAGYSRTNSGFQIYSTTVIDSSRNAVNMNSCNLIAHGGYGLPWVRVPTSQGTKQLTAIESPMFLFLDVAEAIDPLLEEMSEGDKWVAPLFRAEEVQAAGWQIKPSMKPEKWLVLAQREGYEGVRFQEAPPIKEDSGADKPYWECEEDCDGHCDADLTKHRK